MHGSSGLFLTTVENCNEGEVVRKRRRRRTATEHANFEFSPSQEERLFCLPGHRSHSCLQCVCHIKRETTDSKPGLFTHLSALMQTDSQCCSTWTSPLLRLMFSIISLVQTEKRFPPPAVQVSFQPPVRSMQS